MNTSGIHAARFSVLSVFIKVLDFFFFLLCIRTEGIELPLNMYNWLYVLLTVWSYF